MRFRDLSIRTKLLTGFMLTSLTALLIMMAALATFDRRTFEDEALRDTRVLAGIIGENGATSIAFNDSQGARATLAALRAQPHIINGFLYDREGHLFASYSASNAGSVAPPMPPDGALIRPDRLSVAAPVLFNDKRICTVY